MTLLTQWRQANSPGAITDPIDRVFLIHYSAVWWTTIAMRGLAIAIFIVQAVTEWPNPLESTAPIIMGLAVAVAIASSAFSRPAHFLRTPWLEIASFALALFVFGRGAFASSIVLLVAAAPSVAYLIEFRSSPIAINRTLFAAMASMFGFLLGSLGWMLIDPEDEVLPFLFGALGFLSLFAFIQISRHRWRLALNASLDLSEHLRRQAVSIYSPVQRLVHDGLLVVLDQASAGQLPAEAGRERARDLARLARGLLENPAPRSIEQLVDDARSHAAAIGVRLDTIVNSDGEPPRPVIAHFADALGALIANLRHADVKVATLTLDTGPSWLALTLSDAGIGRSPEMPWGTTTTTRVLDQLASIGGDAQVESSPGSGVIWRLHWSHQ